MWYTQVMIMEPGQQSASRQTERCTSRHCMGGMRSLPRLPDPLTLCHTLLTPPSKPQSVYSVMGARSCTADSLPDLSNDLPCCVMTAHESNAMTGQLSHGMHKS